MNDVDSVDFVHEFMKVSKQVERISNSKEVVYSHSAFRLVSSGVITESKNGFRTIESIARPSKNIRIKFRYGKDRKAYLQTRDSHQQMIHGHCLRSTGAGFSAVEDMWTLSRTAR
jgi:hypothetical protein